MNERISGIVKAPVNDLKTFLDRKYKEYNQPGFIENDPISIPHRYKKKQDIEIAGLFAATLAWGQRKTIIDKCSLLMNLMDNEPHNFILHHKDKDLKRFLNFKHRTFNSTDTLYFIHFLRWFYQRHKSLEEAFTRGKDGLNKEENVGAAIGRFHDLFFHLPDHPQRTKKHISTPAVNSACKRLNMYLRWMVRKDDSGVDFGIWQNLKSHQLICPCDIHVRRVARRLGLMQRKQTDWKSAVELTENLKILDPEDPAKYDFALFGLGVVEKYAFDTSWV